MLITLGQRYLQTSLAVGIALLASCKAPPQKPVNGVGLPVPPGLEHAGHVSASASQPIGSRYLRPGQAGLDLTPMKVIHLAFELSPRIRAAYLKYAGEKARYDYTLATWTSTTPGMAIGPGWNHALDVTDTITNHQTQKMEAFVEKNFLDTSRLRAFAGGLNEDTGETHAFHPSVGGLFRFPLWGSREALQRSSNQIFQQTQVNDAQLEYVKQVRGQLADIAATFFAVLGIGQRVEIRQRQIDDLEQLRQRSQAAGKSAADLQRLQAEMTTAGTELRSQQSNYAIELAWMTSTMGLPRPLDVRLIEEPFNPFGEEPQDDLLALSLQADPEIATLKNAIGDAQVQLALARKGRLDVAMNLGATADLRGSGDWTGQTEYRADALLSVGFIDPRLSSSLAREATANIRQYQCAIERRQKQVYAEAMEPLIKIRMLAKNIPDRQRNVERYRQDFQGALQNYFAGQMDIDDLLRRRQGLLNEEFDLSFSKSELGVRIVALAAATGKFFELLAQPVASQPTDAPASQPAPTTRATASRPGGPASPLAANPAATERTRCIAELMQEIHP